MVRTPPHLGGHLGVTHVDQGALKFFWKLGCRSLLDVGCGPGGQVKVAEELGYSALGIDGDCNVWGPPYIVGADFVRGWVRFPWKFDLVWSVEVAEHVVERHRDKFLKTCVENCGKYLLLTASINRKPKKHVNVKSPAYWRDAVESLGLRYSEECTQSLREASTMRRGFLKTTGQVFVRGESDALKDS